MEQVFRACIFTPNHSTVIPTKLNDSLRESLSAWRNLLFPGATTNQFLECEVRPQADEPLRSE